MKIRDPETLEEWQEAVDMAAFLLQLHRVRPYGLFRITLPIDAERCNDILVRGHGKGIHPTNVQEKIQHYFAGVARIG